MKFLLDENVKGWYYDALVTRFTNEMFVRIQDVGLLGAQDPEILEWAAQDRRILLTHDFKTMPMYAYQRVAASLPMPGVLQIDERASVRSIVDEFVMIVECTDPEEWRDIVSYIPLR